MTSRKTKKIFFISVIVIVTSFIFGIFERLIITFLGVQHDYFWGYVYLAGVWIFDTLIILLTLRKFNLLEKTKFTLFRLFAFFLSWAIIEDIGYWITDRYLLYNTITYPFPVGNWWSDFFPSFGGVIGNPSLFAIPLGYFISAAIFIFYLFLELKLIKQKS